MSVHTFGEDGFKSTEVICARGNRFEVALYVREECEGRGERETEKRKRLLYVFPRGIYHPHNNTLPNGTGLQARAGLCCKTVVQEKDGYISFCSRG